MPAARATMFFGQAETGWSETWWYPAGFSTAFYVHLENMVKARVDMLQGSHRLIACRISEEGANRFCRTILGGGDTAIDAGGKGLNLPAQGKEDGEGNNLEGRSDQVRSALQIEVIRGGLRIGLRYLAGFPDDISLTENPTLNKDWRKTWWGLFDKWRQRIVMDGWAIKMLDKSPQNVLMPVQTWRMRAAAPSVLGVVVDAAQPFTNQVGQQIALQGVRMIRRGLDSPNGTWYIDGIETVQQTGQRTIWLRATEQFDPSTFLTLGKIRQVVHGYATPSWLEPLRVGIHKRGKPFGSPVGRRKTR